MCTVTYLPLGDNNFILTSNRDEDPKRKTVEPQKYVEDNVELLYPKDDLAGGTWIGLSNKNRLVCLLNGGFENHIKQKKYKHSRGIIVKKLLKSDNAVEEIRNFELEGVEPFTIVLVDWNKNLTTYELVWTGIDKHFKELSQEPHVWSSATLYTSEMKIQREIWFANWLSENENYNQEKIVLFHQNEKLGNQSTSIKMKRDTVETVSTTSVCKQNKTVSMDYFDYLSEEVSNVLV